MDKTINLFKVKQEKKLSRFNRATMIIEKDRGKGTTKRFLFDDHATKSLKLQEGAELGFILSPLHKGAMFIADLSTVDKEALHLSEEDYNSVHKTRIKFDLYPEEDYLYSVFTNRILHERISEEFELDNTSHYRFILEVANDFPELETIKKYLNSIGVTVFYNALFDGKLSTNDWLNKAEAYLTTGNVISF